MQKLVNQTVKAVNNQMTTISSETLDFFLQEELSKWILEKNKTFDCLSRTFSFDNFSRALNFANQIGLLAERHQHHPKITINWGEVIVSWFTHTTQTIHLNDCIMAAHTDLLANG